MIRMIHGMDKVLQRVVMTGIVDQIILEATAIQHKKERNQAQMTTIVYKNYKIYIGVCSGC